MLFFTLKEGCRVEALQLSSVQRTGRAPAVYLVVSWRIRLLMRLGRAYPNRCAERLLAREEWQAAWIVARRTPPYKPLIALELVQRAQAAGIAFRAVVADSAYGENDSLEAVLLRRRIPYVMARRGYANQG